MIVITNLKRMKEQWMLINTKIIMSLTLQGSWIMNTNFMEEIFISPLNKNNDIGMATTAMIF